MPEGSGGDDNIQAPVRMVPLEIIKFLQANERVGTT